MTGRWQYICPQYSSYCLDRISIGIIVFLLWVRLDLQNEGQALRLGRLGGRALQLEQAGGLNQKTAQIEKMFMFFFVSSFFVFWVMGLFFSHLNSLSTLSTFCVLTFFLPDLCWVQQPKDANLCRQKNISCFDVIFSVGACIPLHY